MTVNLEERDALYSTSEVWERVHCTQRALHRLTPCCALRLLLCVHMQWTAAHGTDSTELEAVLLHAFAPQPARKGKGSSCNPKVARLLKARREAIRNSSGQPKHFARPASAPAGKRKSSAQLHSSALAADDTWQAHVPLSVSGRSDFDEILHSAPLEAVLARRAAAENWLTAEVGAFGSLGFEADSAWTHAVLATHRKHQQQDSGSSNSRPVASAALMEDLIAPLIVSKLAGEGGDNKRSSMLTVQNNSSSVPSMQRTSSYTRLTREASIVSLPVGLEIASSGDAKLLAAYKPVSQLALSALVASAAARKAAKAADAAARSGALLHLQDSHVDYMSAELLLQKAYCLREKAFGVDSPLTRQAAQNLLQVLMIDFRV